MAKLYAAQWMVVQAILDSQGVTPTFIDDGKISKAPQFSLPDTRGWLLIFDHENLIEFALAENRFDASVDAKGRLSLGLYRHFPTPIASKASEPYRSSSRTGRQTAQVIGINDYSSPITRLPDVASNVRESANLMRFDGDQFPGQSLAELVDQVAYQRSVLDSLRAIIGDAQLDDALFAHLAGHGDSSTKSPRTVRRVNTRSQATEPTKVRVDIKAKSSVTKSVLNGNDNRRFCLRKACSPGFIGMPRRSREAGL
jgi:hypothetical protein